MLLHEWRPLLTPLQATSANPEQGEHDPYHHNSRLRPHLCHSGQLLELISPSVQRVTIQAVSGLSMGCGGGTVEYHVLKSSHLEIGLVLFEWNYHLYSDVTQYQQ